MEPNNAFDSIGNAENVPRESADSYPVAPSPPNSYPVAPRPPNSYPVAPRPPNSYPVAPRPPNSYPVAPRPPNSYPVAPRPPNSYPVAPRPPNSYPVAPRPPNSYPVAPRSPNTIPVAPRPPNTIPVAPRRSTDAPKTETVSPPTPSNGWQIDKHLAGCMLTMFDAHMWTDITFRCADQNTEDLDDRVRAHKIVLAARSPVFEAMFFGPCQDKNVEIEIGDAEREQFEMFIRLLYSDDLDLYDDYDDLTDILQIAHKYQVQTIVNGCCRKLGDKVSIENACDLLDRALLYDNQYLTNIASEFVDQNASEVLKSDGFLKMSLQCLTYVLKGNTFYAKESDILNRAIEWAQQRCENSHDGQVIRKALGEAFYYLRTPAMTCADFLACTMRKEYYSLPELEDIVSTVTNKGNDKAKVVCNSTTPRSPFEFTIERRPESEGTGNKFDTSMTEELTITPKDDIYLTDVQLMKFVSVFSTHKDRYLYSAPEQRMDHTITDMPLSVEITIAGVMKIYTIHCGDSCISPEIHFQEPIHLSSGISHSLKVTVLQKMSDTLTLRSFTAPTHFIGSDIVCVETKAANHPLYAIPISIVVKCITFKCKSKR